MVRFSARKSSPDNVTVPDFPVPPAVAAELSYTSTVSSGRLPRPRSWMPLAVMAISWRYSPGLMLMRTLPSGEASTATCTVLNWPEPSAATTTVFILAGCARPIEASMIPAVIAATNLTRYVIVLLRTDQHIHAEQSMHGRAQHWAAPAHARLRFRADGEC